jgi:flagellar assembly protein FliH
MPPLKSIAFNAPLKDVALLPPLSAFAADALRRKAEREAYEKGRMDAERLLSAQLLEQRSELLELQQGIFTALRDAVSQVVLQTEQQLLHIALESARKVVGGMEISPELVESVVREAVGEIEDGSEVTIQLHATDLALLRKHQSPVLQGLPNAGQLRFTASTEVTRGGCLVQTRFGVLDARRETKFEQLQESLNA